MHHDRRRGIALTAAIGLAVAYLVLTRLFLAWNGIVGADGARDLAVTLRLLRGEEFPLQGPLFGGVFYLGPLYYFVVAAPLALFGTATAVISFLACLTLLGVFFAYRVGTLLFDRRTGVLFACLLAGDFTAALAAFHISNAGLILPASLALLYTTLLAVIHRRPGYLAIAIALAAAALQIHPVTVTLLPLLIVAACLPTAKGKATALTIGAAFALVLFAPYLAYEFTHHGENLGRLISHLGRPRPIGEGLHLTTLPKILWWAVLLGPRAATQISEGITPVWLRALAIATLHAASIAGLVGLGLTIVGLFQRERRQSCALVLCWFLPWWLIVPGALSPLTWWYLYPIQPVFLLFAAVALARLFDHVPTMRRWPAISLSAFGLFAFALPAWLGMAAFERSAKEGLLRLPASLLLRSETQATDAGDFVYPTIGIRQEERLTKALLHEAGCDGSLITRLHGLPLWLTLQSRGVLLALHQSRCRSSGDPVQRASFVGLRRSDLPSSFRLGADPVGPMVIVRESPNAHLAEGRYTDRLETGWEAVDFNDRAWLTLQLPALRPPDPAAYPPPPDMTWVRSPIFVRAKLRYSGTGTLLLGIAFPSSAPWLYQGHTHGLFVNGRPAPPPRLRAAYLILYELGSVLTPGENLVALAIGGAPHFTLDLFAIASEP